MRSLSKSHEQTVAASQFSKEREYWLKKLSGQLVKTSFPYDTSRKTNENSLDSLKFQLPGELVPKLMKLDNGSDLRLHMIMITALAVLLHRYTANSDIIVGTPVLTQELELQFINTVLILRIEIKHRMTFKELLLQVRQTIIEATENQNYPVETLPDQLNISSSAEDYFPLLDIVLLLENIHEKKYIRHIHPNIIFSFCRSDEKMEGTVEFNTGLYSKSTMERILHHFTYLLAAVLADINLEIAAVEILTADEKKQLLVEFNAPGRDTQENKTLRQLFEEQVKKTPDNIAVVGMEGGGPQPGRHDFSITYGKLNEKSNQLAHLLCKKGVKPDTIVAIMLARSIAMIAALLGVLKSGGAYLPIEPGFPRNKIKFILADSAVELLIGRKDGLFAGDDLPGILDLNEPAIDREDAFNPAGVNHPGRAAYTIYTSGTTGKPKGVVVDNAQAVNTLLRRREVYQMDTSITSLQLFSYVFDGFVTSFFTPLISAAKTILMSDAAVTDIQAIKAAIINHHVTHFISVPSLYSAIIDYLTVKEVSTLKVVTLAGETLSPGILEATRNKNQNLEIINEYGVTEAAVMSTIFRHQEKDDRIKIGKPIGNTKIYVLDSLDRLQPIGVVGELCIGGIGTARGYLNSPKLTREKFVFSSVGENKAERLYRTADLARWLPDGNLELLGRIDHQVKIRGYRIELEEIENQLQQHPKVKEAVVIAKESDEGGKYLWAYLSKNTSEKINAAEIREFLSLSLPGYMIPSYFVELERMPLTPTNKIDRKKLVEMNRYVSVETEYLPPRNETEKWLVEIWGKMLDLGKVGRKDKFFNIGGDSIKTISLLSLINNKFGVNLKVVDLYENETIEKITTRINQFERDAGDQKKKEILEQFEQLKNRIIKENKLIKNEDIEDLYPMSDIEKGMVYHYLKDSARSTYHNQIVFQVRDEAFNAELFSKAWELLAEKHPNLRTGYSMYDFEEPVRVIYKRHFSQIVHYDLAPKDRPEQKEYIEAILKEDLEKPFDFQARELLWRMKTFAVDFQNICLVWTCHHAMIDGWSSASLFTELNNLYWELKRNINSHPGTLKSSYKDFVIEQILLKRKDEIIEFWKKELEGYKRFEFPKKAKNSDEPVRVREHPHALSLSLLEGLKNTADRYNTSVKHLCFGAYVYMLSILSYDNDLVTGLITNNRPVCEDGDKIIGCFLNTIPVRLKIPGNLRWIDYIEHVEKKLVELKKYETLSLHEIIKVIGEKTRMANPITDTIFNYTDFHIYTQLNHENLENDNAVRADAALSIAGNARTNTLFDFSVDTTLGIFRLWISYSTSILDEEDIIKLSGYYETILGKLSSEPEGMMRKEDLLSAQERQKLLYAFNETDSQYPKDKTIHELFTEQVERTPDHLALIGQTQGSKSPMPNNAAAAGDDISITYNELNEKAKQLVYELKEKGILEGNILAIMTGQCVEMLAGILGILKAGCAYLPIDSEYPQERVHYMLADSGARILVTTPGIQVKAGSQYGQLQRIILQSAYLKTAPSTLTSRQAASSAGLAYIIYTSGTTGKPKGVMINHRNLVSLLVNDSHLFDFNRSDVWTLFHSFCFDFSVWEMHGALLYGGKLIIVPRTVARDPGQYREILKKHKVTVLNQTPSAFYNLANEELKHPENRLNTRYVIFGGEALNPLKLKTWQAKYPETRLINMFGITETTVHVTYKKITRQEIGFNTSNIGKPIPTLSTYVMGKNLDLLPPGVAGELCVGGEGVSRGYLNNPELTGVKFVANPFKPGQKLYRSGDLVRILENLEMEYLGRIDLQVQIRGFRVELGEIESQLLTHKEISETVVLARKDKYENLYLCAYVVAKEKLSTPQLREFLLGKIPGYIVPSYFVQLDKIPLNPNGKWDKNALPEPGTKENLLYAAPKNELQAQLAHIWEKELAVEKVGITDNFFDIGGDSIKAIKLLSVINNALNANLKVVDLFTNETIEKLAAQINPADTDVDKTLEEASKEIEELNAKIRSKNNLPGYENIEDVYPMSDIEKGMVFHQFKEPGRAIYHDQMVYQVTYVDFDPGRFKKAMTLMVEKHEILRTSFNMGDFAEPVQLVHKQGPLDLQHYNIANMERHEQEEYIRKFIAADQGKPMDISVPPLWRMKTFALGGDLVFIFFVCHHAILDGWSDASFNTELNNIYLALASEPGFKPGKLKSSYKDYIIEQIAEKRKKENINYWRKELDGHKRFKFPEEGENKNSPQGMKSEALDLGSSLLNRLRTVALTYNTNLKHLCFGAYVYMLGMLSYERDLVVGMVTNNRPICEDGEKILGCFLNTVPVRIKIPFHIKWSEYILLVDKKLLELKRYERLPLSEIARVSGEKAHERNPIFDALFGLIDFHVYKNLTPQDHDHDRQENRQASAKKPLDIGGQVIPNTLFNFVINTTSGSLLVGIPYSNELISDEMIKKCCHYFKQILGKFIDGAEELIEKDQLISLEEKQTLLYEFNTANTVSPGNKTLHELFAEQVERNPDHMALVGQIPNPRSRDPYRKTSLTYNELNRRANPMAHILRKKGIIPGTLVGLMIEPSLEMIISIMAILKTGGAYLPIDPQYPPERNRYMLKDSSIAIILTTKKWANSLPYKAGNIYCLEENELNPAGGNTSNPQDSSKPGNLAVVLYTSGTTSNRNPKGVLIQHGNAAGMITHERSSFDFNRGDVWTMFHSYCYSLSLGEMYGALLNGGKLVLTSRTTARVPRLSLQCLKENNVTVLIQTPSSFHRLLELELTAKDQQLNLRYVILGGETLEALKLKEWKSKYPCVKLINSYGITETTGYLTYKEITPKESEADSNRIGTPGSTSSTYIFDSALELTPLGVPGELGVSGDSVARGYLNQPELTRNSFIEHPYKKGERLCRSGDLVKLARDGEMQYLGGIDEEIRKTSQAEYWSKELAPGVTVLKLPKDYRPAAVPPDHVSTAEEKTSPVSFTLSKTKTLALKNRAHRDDTTPFVLLTAAYYVLLSRLSGQEDIVIGISLPPHRHRDLQHNNGRSKNLLPLRNTPASQKTVAGFLKEVKEKILNAFENQEYSLENLAEPPVINAMFASRDFIGSHHPLKKEKFEIMLTHSEEEDALVFDFFYNGSGYKKETIERFARYYQQILNIIIGNPWQKIEDIEIISSVKTTKPLEMIKDAENESINKNRKNQEPPARLEADFDY